MELQLSLSKRDFYGYIDDLLKLQFPDGAKHNLADVLDEALKRTAECFSPLRLPGYLKNGKPYLNHLHGDQSAVFYYFLSNSAFHSNDRALAEKAMLLNKARNGIVVTFDTQLPPHFLLVHTVGTMLGKAVYGDYFVATQNVTVGTHKGNAPVFGRGVILYPRSFVAGKCAIGDFSRIATGATVIDVACGDHSVVAGESPQNVVKRSQRETISEYFDL